MKFNRTKFFLFFFAFYGNAEVVYSQNLSLIDSLRESLNTEQLTARQFDLLNAIGFEYRYSYPDSTIYYCTRAYELGKKISIKKNLSKPLSFIGLAFANKGDYKKSSEYHEQAINIAIQQQDSVQLAFGYNNLGRMYFDGGDLVRSYDNLIRSKDIFEVIQDQSGLAYVYRSLANVYKSQGDFEKAIAMSTQAFELRKKIGERRSIVSSLLELGLIYEEKGDTKEALAKLQIADSLAKRINDPTTLAELELGVAEILLSEKRYIESYAKANAVLKTISGITNLKLFIRASLIRGEYFLYKKNYSLAIPIFKDIILKAEQSGNLAYQIEATKNIAICYQEIGEKSQAEDMINQSEILGERIRNTDLEQQIERLRFQLEIEKKEKENEFLKSVQIKNESLIASQRFQNRLLLTLIVSVSLIMVVLLIYARKRKIINEMLQTQNEQIIKQQDVITNVNKNLRKQNLQLNELNNEKNSLMSIVAHDLKSPINRIAGLAGIMELEGNNSKQQQEYLAMIKAATKAGDDLIKDLLDVSAFEANGRAPVITDVPVGELLEQRVNTFYGSAEIKSIQLLVAHTFTGTFKSDADSLNRIIDNLVSNAIKFSPRDSKVSVTGMQEGSAIIISVKDNGPGFSESDKVFLYQKFKRLSAQPTGGESSNGLGLAIVKTLVDRLGGEIVLFSEQGKGAEFQIRISESKG
ncbi:MAG: tetratricopeptide repeat protein [Cyclobacteriaceae bacterium]|nr:tetratricopeptide repeat protein [Cyclobacteriaceae bacterium]